MKKVAAIFVAIFIAINFTGCIKEDSDGDGLPDNIEKEGWEVRVIYPGQTSVTTYHVSSNPNKKDTDGDGLTDYEELMMPGGATDPNKKDTDGDGLTDYEEARAYHTDPLKPYDDIDDDNFPAWQGDYGEIEYYKKRGVDDKKIREYLQNPDVDGDGVKDGYDKDPLSDLKINITIKGLKIWSMMDGSNDKILEIEINVSSDASSHAFKLPPVIVGKNYSLNYSCTLDLDDRGIPDNLSNSLSITVVDLDNGEERKPLDADGLPSMDIVGIYRAASKYGGIYLNSNFNITKDCHAYNTKGKDGELWFEISNASIAK
ncbi:MAG: hypothetical protein J7K47_03850 [Thermoplasmata archaeon]|nr:hypothetical protein [Thermoplasmata archaeon]